MPRLYTKPLVEGPPGPCGCGCALTPETSVGFDQVEFAEEVLYHPMDPWQRWVIIHGGELLPDGSLRFRHVIVIVARQNGKSQIPIVLGLYWMFVDRYPIILWTSTQLKYAVEALRKAEEVARRSELASLLPQKRWLKTVLGSSYLEHESSRFLTVTANAEGGRSLTINRLVQDELRQHRDYDAWKAAVPALTAEDAQAWHLSNAGEDHSIVLNEQRAAALAGTEDPDTDTAIFEYSCAEGTDPQDLEALSQANPGLGYRRSARELLSDAKTALRSGAQALAGFKTERMCIRVRHMDPAVDPDHWRKGTIDGDLSDARDRIALCLDVSPDLMHATLCAAASVDEGKVRVEIVEAWDGMDCTKRLMRDLPALVARVRPKVLGWYPGGPAASLSADLKTQRPGAWPPRGVKVEEIRAEVPAVCMGLAEQVVTDRIIHSPDELLDDHISAAEKARIGDAWRYSRNGEGHVDAAYAAAGAVHLARTLPPPIGGLRIVLPNGVRP